MPDQQTAFEQLGLSLLLGLLVGLQRERSGRHFAGFRTFPLATAAGTLSAQLARYMDSPWIVAAALLGMVAIAVTGRAMRRLADSVEQGITTELALLQMFVVGAYLAWGPWLVAIAVGGGVAVLLQFKAELHGLAARLGDVDLKAIMQFVLVAFIILPVLPNRTFGPGDLHWEWIAPDWRESLTVFNPFDIWRMVVLIVGIGLASYVLFRALGANAGLWLGGVLGGAVSSTATTVGCARQVQSRPELAWVSALVIAIASGMVYVRVLLEVSAVNAALLPYVAAPALMMLAAALVPPALAWLWMRRSGLELPVPGNPSELKSAILFAAVYATVLLALSAARHGAGDRGMYVVSALSGLTDMDAVTLSAARLAHEGRVPEWAALRMILTAAIANTAFKATLAWMIGGGQLWRRTAALMLPQTAVAAGLLYAWPPV